MLKYLDDLCLLSYDTDWPQFITSMCALVWKTNNLHLLFVFVQTALHTVVVCAGTNEFGTGSLMSSCDQGALIWNPLKSTFTLREPSVLGSFPLLVLSVSV